MHRFISSYCPPGRWVREEPQTRLDLALDEAMILLDDVIHILARPALAFAWQELFAFEIADSTDVSGVLVDIDHSWSSEVRSAQDFAEKALSRSSASRLVQKEIERLTCRVDSSIQIHPLPP